MTVAQRRRIVSSRIVAAHRRRIVSSRRVVSSRLIASSCLIASPRWRSWLWADMDLFVSWSCHPSRGPGYRVTVRARSVRVQHHNPLSTVQMPLTYRDIVVKVARTLGQGAVGQEANQTWRPRYPSRLVPGQRHLWGGGLRGARSRGRRSQSSLRS